MKPVEWSPQARLDAAGAALWYAQQGGLALGERFLADLETATDFVSGFPAAGSALHAPLFPDLPVPLRFHPLDRFDRFLLYYVALPGHVEIIRVWNASRGLEPLMQVPPR